MKKATHAIEYKMENGYWHFQKVYGHTELYNLLRSMQKDGYTEFKIMVLKD